MPMQELYQVVVDNLLDGIVMVDLDKNIMVWNDAAQRITGYTFDEVAVNNYMADLLDVMILPDSIVFHGHPIHTRTKDEFKRFTELIICHKKGYKVPVVVKSMPVYSGRDIVGSMAVFTDNNQLQKRDLFNSLTKQVMTDPLTGLPNRRYIESILPERLEERQRYGGHCCVLFINLDDFSQYNKTYGRNTSDDMLVRLANNFKASLRNTDVIGRWADEEFLGIFEVKSFDQLQMLTQKVKKLITSSKISVNKDQLGVTGSIGVTMAHNGDTPKQLINRSIALMHVSKISGKNCVTIG